MVAPQHLLLLCSAAVLAASHAFTTSQICSSIRGRNLHRQAVSFSSCRTRSTQLHKTQHDALLSLASSSSSQLSASTDPRLEPRTIHKVTIDLPLGIVLEEMDDVDPSYGVVIIGISSEGNAATCNANIFSSIKSNENGGKIGIDQCICIRDKIISVNSSPCHDKGFDDVISLISNAGSNTVTLELGRLQQSTVVNYYNGICIAAKAGESYGFLASKCGVTVDYECRNGSCLTCARWMEFPDKMQEDWEDSDNGGTSLEENEGEEINLYERTILHCVGKVPRRYRWLHVLEPGVVDAENNSSQDGA